MDRHNQTHNDIKPQNFLVKFRTKNDWTQIKIALTDFGMADSDTKGGTPIFASPECFEKKEKKSDIFSFGRVILFLLLTKNQFVKWLFVPIKDKSRTFSLETIRKTIVGPAKGLYWISQMMSLTNRMNLKLARELFNQQRLISKIKLSHALVTVIDDIIKEEMCGDFNVYTSELCDFR